MAAEQPGEDPNAEELTEVIRTIRERVRARHPQGLADGMPIALPDLMPVVHARDAAQAKVAAIGGVNPRPPGLLNSVIQKLKKLVARALDWHVRDQVEFNRGMIACVESLLEAMNESNRATAALASEFSGRLAGIRSEMQRVECEVGRQLESLRAEAAELKDIRAHWVQWRADWERKLSINEVQFLRSVADLQAAFQHRSALMESNFHTVAKAQHSDFTGALERTALEIQKKLWADMENIRRGYERMIHAELRVVRQRASASAAPGVPEPTAAPASPVMDAGPRIDYLRFAGRFRGSEEYIRRNQTFYLSYFTGRERVLDLGCGRGEFLEMLRDAGVPALGIDVSEESAAICRAKGLRAEASDLFRYLEKLPERALDGIFCSQVVEHLPAAGVPELVRLAASRLERDGVLAIETPNPECLAIFSTHFYLDPTHTRPIPPALLVFYLEEAGFGSIEVHRLSPAEESLPGLTELPEEFRKNFFGGLDYAVIGRKLG